MRTEEGTQVPQAVTAETRRRVRALRRGFDRALRRFDEGMRADAGFDGGEYSGPAQAQILDDKLRAVFASSGLTESQAREALEEAHRLELPFADPRMGTDAMAAENLLDMALDHGFFEVWEQGHRDDSWDTTIGELLYDGGEQAVEAANALASLRPGKIFKHDMGAAGVRVYQRARRHGQ